MKRKTKTESSESPKKSKKSLKVSFTEEITGEKVSKSKKPKDKAEKKSKFEKSTQKKSKLEKEKSAKLSKVQKLTEKINKKKEIAEKKEKKSKLSNSDESTKKQKCEKEKKSSSNLQKSDQIGEKEKPDWKEFKMQKKEIKIKRKEQKLKDFYPTHAQVIKLSEQLRREDLPKEERKEISEKLHSLLKGSYNQVVNTHDISRVIQWLLRYGDSIREELLTELKPSWTSMFFSKYAKKCLVSACEYTTKETRKGILDACTGQILKMHSSADTLKLFEKLFSLYATSDQKTFFKQEFYGDLYKSGKDPSVKNLEDTFKNDPVMKSATLSAVKANLTKIINKQLLDSTLFHTVLCEFLHCCSTEDRTEMIQSIRESSLRLTESKPGAEAAIICIWHGTNKDRKVIMKSLKERLKEVMMSEHGHLVLMALIDSVDDTILMKKVLLSEMVKDLREIVANEYGRKVVLYLLARRQSRFFHPREIEFFQRGDGNANSKKPADIREAELVDHVIDDLLKDVEGNLDFWLANGSNQMVTYAVLISNHDRDLRMVFEAIVEFVMDREKMLAEENEKKQNEKREIEKRVKAVEHAGLHVMLKKLFTENKESVRATFCEAFVGKLNDEGIGNLISCNRGCFLLVLAAEQSKPEVVEILREKLAGFKDELKKKTFKGASILLSKI